jgi:tetratricopeptide (TPR) repeat protein
MRKYPWVLIWSCIFFVFQGCGVLKYRSQKPLLTPGEYNDLGVTYENQVQYELAVKAYKKALEIQKNYLTAWINLGNVYSKMKDYPKAEKAYRQALRIDQSSWIARNNLAWIYVEQKKNLETALTLIENCTDMTSEYRPYCLDTLGMIHYYNGNSNKALELITKSIQSTSPEQSALRGQQYFHLGMIYLSQQEKDKAIYCFRQSIESDTGSEWAEKAREQLRFLQVTN